MMIKNIQQNGFTLLEALLTLFVLSVGVLGAAGLQMQGMRSSNMSLQRTIVVMKTQEIIERMRVNKDGVRNGDYTGIAQDNGCNSGSTCSTSQLAAHDLFTWQTELAQMLPSVNSSTIVIVPGANANLPSMVTVTTTWTDRTDNNLTYSVSVGI